jgi:hypothetical protein
VVIGASDPFLFHGERYGRFQYVIPAMSGKYRLTLHFAEFWFGPGNQGGGRARGFLTSPVTASSCYRIWTCFEPPAARAARSRAALTVLFRMIRVMWCDFPSPGRQRDGECD